MYIVEATESELVAMEAYEFNIIPSDSYRTLDLYPYDVVFDTTEAVPAAPSAMDGFGWDRQSYIVQFIGPYTPGWLVAIEDMGASVGKLAQRYSAVVKMSPDVKSMVSEQPFVQWVGAYQPWHKISSDVLDTEGGLRVEIMAFDDSMRDSLSSKLVDLGASVITTYSPGFVVAYLDSRILPWVVSMPEVMEVHRTGVSTVQDVVAAEIMGAFDSWDPARSGLPSSLTGRSPGPDGIDYTPDDIYEVVGIQDSGFDVGNQDAGHPDFFLGPVGDRVIRYIDRTGRSNPDGMQSGTAHGTHVAGDAIGNGFAWEYARGYPTNDANWENSEGVGMAPEAMLSMDGVQGLGGLAADPSYWDSQYVDGAHVYSNSYGRNPGDYGGSSPAADMRMDAENNRLVVFAASNEGPDLNTLGPGSQAKNGITAGASLNFRPDWFQADNPNIMADFSSRGGPGQSLCRLKPDMVSVGTASIAPMGPGEWEHNLMVGINNPQPSFIMTVDVYNQNNPTALDGDGINDYRYMDGTSVASPHMAGLTLLVREYLREIAGYSDPYAINSQLVKALMVNGAVRMDEALYEYPGYDQGWGRVNLINSLFPPVPRTSRWEEGTMATPGSWFPSFTTSVQSDDVPLKITLTWVDRWGRDLFRDVDLLVTSPSGDVYKGNVYGTVGQFDGWSIPNPIASDANPLWDRYNSDAFDDLNNVEQVEVQFPEVGTWQVEVIGRSLPSTAPFALVVSADFGPQTEHKIDLDSDYPTSLEITKGGQVFFPFEVTNFGTNTDNVFLSAAGPAQMTMNFESSFIADLEPRETVSTWVTIDVDQAFPSCGIQDLKITGTYHGNTSITDRLELELAVSCDIVVTPIQITTDPVDELDQSVLTFNNGTADHIFIAYNKTNPVDPTGRFGGGNVYVAHTTLDAQGMPVQPFNHTLVSNWNDDPNDLRWTYMPGGKNKSFRVILTWTGDDPDAFLPDYDSYGVSAHADPPLYDNWHRVVIERNAGSQAMNEARMNIPNWRDDGTTDGEVIWVWEHLDYTGPDSGNPIAVQTWIAISRDSGETWGNCSDPLDDDCRRISPFDNNYYFFPNSCVDSRNVLWVFFYYRLPAGDDRDLLVRLYDDGRWMGDDTPINPRDDVSLLWNTDGTNIQWPACVATTEGPAGNRMYVVVTNDEGAVDLRLYVGYLDGHYEYNTTSGIFNRPWGLNLTELEGVSPNLHPQPLPAGPFATSVSNSNYDRRPILNMVGTDDGYTWIQYIENANEFNEPNLWTYDSIDGFATAPSLSKLTADPFAKGHQMTDSLTIGGMYHNVYEVYHASKGTVTEVNYDVYCSYTTKTGRLILIRLDPLSIQ
ncbi:MAG: S8 family serine peptidase [Methanobacteriota archaeon]|nr:MAG: S8 family serine peptidase [Euryarchaeota archaeon]